MWISMRVCQHLSVSVCLSVLSVCVVCLCCLFVAVCLSVCLSVRVWGQFDRDASLSYAEPWKAYASTDTGLFTHVDDWFTPFRICMDTHGQTCDKITLFENYFFCNISRLLSLTAKHESFDVALLFFRLLLLHFRRTGHRQWHRRATTSGLALVGKSNICFVWSLWVNSNSD